MDIENGISSDSNSSEIAKKAVVSVLGQENEYVQRLLTNQIDNVEKKYSSVPLSEIIRNIDHSEVKKTLKESINNLQPTAIDVIKTNLVSEKNSLSLDNSIQSVSSWIINSLLHEKIKYREIREKSERWKYINGTLAIVLPILSSLTVGLIQNYTQSPMCSIIITNTTTL